MSYRMNRIRSSWMRRLDGGKRLWTFASIHAALVLAFLGVPACGQEWTNITDSDGPRSPSEVKPDQRLASIQPLLGFQNTLNDVRLNSAGETMIAPFATSFSNQAPTTANERVAGKIEIFHQPKIIVKARIIEVVREDRLAGRTVIDYLSDQVSDSRIDTHNLNRNRIGQTTSTRFPSGLLGAIESSSGGVVNVTSNNLNFLADFLATEFRADLINCPQVVTLNGQQVSLSSGQNVPFELGQSVLRDGTIAIQETFYKHVGTYLQVTPRIINWGPRGEGLGRRPTFASEVKDFNRLIKMMFKEDLMDDDDAVDALERYQESSVLVTIEDQVTALAQLNRHDPREIEQRIMAKSSEDPHYPYTLDTLFHPSWAASSCRSGSCEFTPSDCTLDLAFVLRQSGAADTVALDLADEVPTNDIANISREEVGAAVANVIQLKSGHGAMIAGLISERDVKQTSKIPILGDIPVLGAAFRSADINRQKTELVIFFEAEVLPSDSEESKAISALDYELSGTYLHADVLENPLEVGIRRAGIGSYLPPRSPAERVYWERLGRKVRKSATAVHDTFR